MAAEWPAMKLVFPILAALLASACVQLSDEASGFVISGAASVPEYEGSATNQTVPFVVSRVNDGGREFEVRGFVSRLDLHPDPVLRAGPIVGVSLPRGDFVESEVVGRLDERGFAVDGGAFVGFRQNFDALPEGSTSGALAVRHDLSGVHDGVIATAELDAFFAATYMFRVGAGAFASYGSGETMSSYFSVDPAGSMASGLPTFDADAGWKDAGAELFGVLSLSENWGLFGRVAYHRLLGDAADSPIVAIEGDDEQWILLAGVFWRFGESF